MRLWRKPLVLALVLSVMGAAAARAGLGIGDRAPDLSILEWVKGVPVDLAKEAKKKIHVVEFWAVWCPPCKISIPLLTDLQKKYKKDVVIIGVTEPDAGSNSPAAIRRFVREQGASMDYTVAIDTGKTTQAYMVSSGAVGIPHAFVVGRDGRIAWQGSPLDPALGDVLKRLVAGTFDVHAAAEAAKIEQEVNKRFDQIDLMARLGRWRQVWEGLTEILKIDPANDVAIDVLMRISIGELNNTDEFRAWVRSHIDTYRQNAKAMQRLASALWSLQDSMNRYPDLAFEAAKAAYDASRQREASAIAVYARSFYYIGDLDRAIALQQDAVAVAMERSEREALKGTLDYYRQCRKLRENVR